MHLSGFESPRFPSRAECDFLAKVQVRRSTAVEGATATLIATDAARIHVHCIVIVGIVVKRCA